MATAVKALMNDAHVKLMIWGEPGSGKSRFALTAPSPLVIDLEGSTRLYASEFDFYVAEVDKSNDNAKNACTLVGTILEEIWNGEYPDVKTLVIDPVTDLLDELEMFCAAKYSQQIGKNVAQLNALQKTRWYAYRRDQARAMLDKIKALPLNLILVSRSKTLWGKGDGGDTSPIGEIYDANPIVESLMDIVINIRKEGNDYIAQVKKSRLGNLPEILPVREYSSILEALDQKSEMSKTAKNEAL